jgi:DNA-binding beta-propeller fold protein YncE
MSDDDPPVPQSYDLPQALIEDEEDPDYPGFGRYGNAIDIAPDGRTVIVADYFNGSIHVLLFDPATGTLSFQQTEWLWKYGTDETAAFPIQYRPVNVAISPDGRTVMGVNCQRSTYPSDHDPDAIFEGSSIPVFTIDRPGHIVRHPDVIMPFEVGGAQSLVYSTDGRRAYLHSIYYDEEPDPITDDIYWMYSEVQVLSITRPGRVRHTGSLRLPTVRGTSQLFGVDCMAITPDGGFLYVTNPTISGASPVIDVINLRTMAHVKQIGTPQDYPDPATENPDDLIYPDGKVIPVGLAFPPHRAVPPPPPNERPVAVITVDKPEVILDIHEIATFDGSGSHDPENSPLTYTWSLVSVPSGASATLTPDGMTAVLTPDPNSEGTYQVGLVVNDGELDSAMATASVTAKFYPVLPPAAALLQRLESNFIFYKEYTNKLTWTTNPENKSTITAIKIYRKLKGADDSSYSLLTSLAPTVFAYEDKGLTQAQLFTYRITSINSLGRESASVVVGN